MAARGLARLLRVVRDLLGEPVRDGVGRTCRRLGGAWLSRPTGARAGAIVVSLALAACGLASLQAQLDRPALLPDQLDWRAAASLLERDGRPGDAVALAPAWLERARAFTPAGLPVLAAPRLVDEPLPGIRRVWLLSAPGVPHAGWDAERDLARRATHSDTQVLGGLEVIRFDLRDPLTPVTSLAELAPDLTELREAGGQARSCVVLSVAPGQTATTSLEDVPLGQTLAGHLSLLPGDGAGPARLEVQVDEQPLGVFEIGPADGRRPFQLDTAQLGYRTHALSLVLTAPAGPTRPLCLEGLALP